MVGDAGPADGLRATRSWYQSKSHPAVNDAKVAATPSNIQKERRGDDTDMVMEAMWETDRIEVLRTSL